MFTMAVGFCLWGLGGLVLAFNVLGRMEGSISKTTLVVVLLFLLLSLFPVPIPDPLLIDSVSAMSSMVEAMDKGLE